MKSIYTLVLEQMSIPPTAALSNPIYTLATVAVASFAADPVREMAPHAMLFCSCCIT